jgi:hypothetical protein
MRAYLLAPAALMIAAPTLAQQSPRQTDPQTVVITGRSLADTDRALTDCIARACPVDQEIDAALAHAENQFVAGDYQKAQRTLSSSARRNRRHGRQYPVAVSDLLRASARVADHLGEGTLAHSTLLDAHRALKSGLGGRDGRSLVAMTEVGDSFMKMGRVVAAEQMYLDAAAGARAANLQSVEAFALIRAATLRAMVDRDMPGRFHLRTPKDAMDKLIADPRPAFQAFAPVARVVRARLAAEKGDKGAIDALIAELKNVPSEQPMLVDYQPIELGILPEFGQGSQISASQMIGVGDFDDEWIDVGFWITADGATADIEVLRSGRQVDQSWVKPVLAHIASRRYVPLKSDAKALGVMRVERYTYTAHWTNDVTGSRIRQRSRQPRIEMLDLSADEAVVKAIDVKDRSTG